MARRLSVEYGTVHRVTREAGLILPFCRAGRLRKISQDLQRVAISAITTGRADTATDVQRMLAADHGVNVSPQTVRNMLKKNGLRASSKAKKPLLTKRHRRLRLQFAKSMKTGP